MLRQPNSNHRNQLSSLSSWLVISSRVCSTAVRLRLVKMMTRRHGRVVDYVGWTLTTEWLVEEHLDSNFWSRTATFHLHLHQQLQLLLLLSKRILSQLTHQPLNRQRPVIKAKRRMRMLSSNFLFKGEQGLCLSLNTRKRLSTSSSSIR